MDQKEILDFFKKTNLPKRYINLCNSFTDYEHAKSPIKKEILDFFKKKEIDLKFSKPDSSFFEDLEIDGFSFRFMLNFKYGLISSLYMLWNDDEVVIRKNLSNISEELDIDFEKKIKYRYPISTSKEDLEIILNETLNIYKEFKDEFIKQQ